MKKFIYPLIICSLLLTGLDVQAGNPDRQGEPGAVELLMNPWARSAGLHTMNTSFIAGAEAIRLNPAGVVRGNQKTELILAHTRYLVNTDISFNALGFSQKMGNGAFGVSLMSLDFGDLPVTTTSAPQGTGATFSPSFFNLGLSYAHLFENKVSVGLTLRFINESTSDLSASGFAIDAGVQYVTGPADNFKFGISLRNVGTAMSYAGEGLSTQRPNEFGEFPFENTFNRRSEEFELPSVLNVGLSYDLRFATIHRLTIMGNFTSNSFTRDDVGAGLEYSLKEVFTIRAAYRYDIGDQISIDDRPVYDGLSAGISFLVPIKKDGENKFGIDYAYRNTRVFQGTHNFSLRFNF